jgi:hypothetical protein
MRYAEYIKELEELKKTPLLPPHKWVKIPIRDAEQFNKCLERGINIMSEEINHGNGFIRTLYYIYVKFDDIIKIF